MKIVKETPTQLNLLSLPIWLWLFGLIFAGIGLAVITGFGKVVTLNCDRTAPTESNCQLKAAGVFSLTPQERKLEALEGAKVERSNSSDGAAFRVVLLTNQGEVPFTDYYSAGENGKQEIATQISTFLGNSQASSLTLQQDDRWFMLMIGGVFVVVGLAVAVVVGEIIVCEFNKGSGNLTVKHHSVLGTKVIERHLHEIDDVRIEESRSNDGSTYRVSLVFTTGDRLPLASYYSSGRQSKQAIVDRLQKFLQHQ
uniref:transmembrane domain-containing protein n=1 Tax=Trichocoleus desertorum TaxID=1481672 RepID=UPI0025B41717|nr:transmembrane domain-containing protein [Trichocoleus desertorum]